MLQKFKAELFKTLGHPVRIQILEYLRTGEMTVSELKVKLNLDDSTVSQQLGRLRAVQLVVGRKDRANVHYSVVDPQVFALLDIARAIFERHLGALQAIADDANEADRELAATTSAQPE